MWVISSATNSEIGWKTKREDSRTVRNSLIASAAFMAVLPLPAQADSTGADLVSSCNGEPGSNEEATCFAYLNGFANGVILSDIAKSHSTPICMPDSTNTDKLREAVKQFALRHPDTLYAMAGPFLARAIMEVYPCRK
jgi:hypothetical protein